MIYLQYVNFIVNFMIFNVLIRIVINLEVIIVINLEVIIVIKQF